MKKNIVIFIILFSTIYSQSIADLERLANEELDKLRSELQAQTKTSIVESIKENSNQGPVSITSTAAALTTGDFFGYNYFRKDISFFDNIPTPADYKLGPGDEVVISLWGETNFRIPKTIDKNGMIYFNDIGFINISNMSLDSAEKVLIEQLSKIYSTLEDENSSSRMMLSLGKLKSINVYFTGYVESPGINLIHPFSDIYSAIVQAGGINSNGSLREIHLIRDGTIIKKIDFYSFLMDGINNFSSIKLIDGDIIHIPLVKKRVGISGAVIRPGTYELLPSENIKDLLSFASGLKSTSSSTLFFSRNIPVDLRSSDDNAKTTFTVDIKDINNILLNNGDSVSIPEIPAVNTRVEVIGRVKSPGLYPLDSGSLKNILDLAGGFNDPIFRKSILENEIVILRKDETNSYSKEFTVDYESSDTFQVVPGDKIFVYTNTDYNNVFTFTVLGEVEKPGRYPFSKKLTLKDAINRAGGITEFGSINALKATMSFKSFDDMGNESTVVREIGNLTPDFEIVNNMTITILPKTNVIRVVGNVYNPGLIAINNNSVSFKKAVELSGGYKPKTLKRKSYIIRANGEVETIGGLAYGSKRIFSGDQVFIPENLNENERDLFSFATDLSSVISNIAAIILIIDSVSDGD